MSIEESSVETENPFQRGERSPFRLRVPFEGMLKARLGKLNIEGLENLENLPKEKPLIIVSTHITDLDVPVVAGVLSSRSDLAIANISAHRKFKYDPLTFLGIHLMGIDNFLSVDYSNRGGVWQAGPFNPTNFNPMIEAIRNGKSIMVAGHNPTYNHILPDRGGYGAVYLAQKAGATILPVGVNIHVKDNEIGEEKASESFQLLKRHLRPDADISIGRPLELEPLDIKSWEEIILNKMPDQNLTEEQQKIMTAFKTKLKEQSDFLMRKLASLIPSEKRGRWKAESSI